MSDLQCAETSLSDHTSFGSGNAWKRRPFAFWWTLSERLGSTLQTDPWSIGIVQRFPMRLPRPSSLNENNYAAHLNRLSVSGICTRKWSSITMGSILPRNNLRRPTCIEATSRSWGAGDGHSHRRADYVSQFLGRSCGRPNN